MRELALQQIEEQINDGDEEIVENYGTIETIRQMSDAQILEVYAFLHCFRG